MMKGKTKDGTTHLDHGVYASHHDERTSYKVMGVIYGMIAFGVLVLCLAN